MSQLAFIGTLVGFAVIVIAVLYRKSRTATKQLTEERNELELAALRTTLETVKLEVENAEANRRRARGVYDSLSGKD